jgi:hypothetical protein
MRSINVWAYSADFGTLCHNARLDPTKGRPAGDDGWDVAVRFTSALDLATKLANGVPMPKQFCGRWFKDCEAIAPGEIARLALLAHGDKGGLVAINGDMKEPYLTPDTIPQFENHLATIGHYTKQNAIILLQGCIAGQGEAGTELLIRLSRIWPGRTVVGFATMGYRHSGEMIRPGEGCENPGMRETDAFSYDEAESRGNRAFASKWNDLKAMPWASQFSPQAKAAREGYLTKVPKSEGFQSTMGDLRLWENDLSKKHPEKPARKKAQAPAR